MPPSIAVKSMYRRGPHYKVAPLLGGNEVNMGLQHSVKYRGIGKKGGGMDAEYHKLLKKMTED